MEFGCLTADQLLDYFHRKWFPSQAAAIERHLSRCNKCAETARKVYEADGEFEMLLSPQARKAAGSSSEPHQL